MRPLRLEVEGFTCYRERQQALDFSELSLFAIAGPTGAGKSSILDTMLYALYGQVPRLGKRGIGDLISHNRDTLSVCLDFDVQDVQYRVVRRAKKRGKSSTDSTAMFFELVAGREKSLADGVREVNEAVQKRLGLGYDQFIQTVILPQNEFARFLHAEPKGQREILQHLLRHGVFERMRSSAEERRRGLQGDVREVAGQLETCNEATAEALAACTEKLADARTRLDQARVDKDDADRKCQQSRRQRELTKEAELLRVEREVFSKKAAEIERAGRELQDAHRAAEVLPRLDALKAASCRAERAASVHDAASKAAASAKKTRDAAANAFATAQTAAQVVNDLAQRLRRLDGIAGDLVTRRQLDAALRKIPAQIKDAAAELESAHDVESSARKNTQELEAQLDEAKQAYDALQFDDVRHARLDALRDDVMHARALLRERDAAASEAQSNADAHSDAKKTKAAAETAHDAARERKAAAERHAQSALEALEGGRTRHRAAALRAHLHAGDDCPVCLQTVVLIPQGDVPPELGELEAAATTATRRATESDRQWQASALALAKANTQESEADKARRASAEKAKKAAAVFAKAMAPLAEMAPPDEEVARGRTAGAPHARGGKDARGAEEGSGGEARVLAWLDAQRAALHAAKLERDRQDVAIRKIQEALANAQLAMANATAAVGQKSERHQGILREQSRLKADAASVVARIAAVTTHADPSKERDEIASEIERLRTDVDNASDTLKRADVEIAKADAQLKAATDAAAEARGEIARTEEQVRQALAHTGFSSADAAAAAVRDVAQKQALDERVNTFERKRAAVLERLGTLEREIAGREVSAGELAEAEDGLRKLQADWLESDQAVVRLEGEHARLATEVQRREQLLAERRVLEASLSVTAELATDLRGDRFQEYMLEEAFKALVASASVRMQAMSNRYTLGWDAGEFYVIDHDNAGERRRAETLSGGETFMASLCLALQLGEEVLRTSGALQMDSLFIDEGFGTLDSEALSEVTDAIESLRQDGNRLIGVISHRRELTERLPGCIRVDKGIGESRWLVERVG